MESKETNSDESEPQEKRGCLTDEQLREIAGIIPDWRWHVGKEYINEIILMRLRGLDSISKEKLALFMVGLRMEQNEKRPESKKFKEPLNGLVAIIDRIESEIKDEQFNDRLHGAVAALSRDEQKRLLTALEKNPASSPDGIGEGGGKP